MTQPPRRIRRLLLTLAAALLVLLAAYASRSSARVIGTWEQTQCNAVEPRITIIKDMNTWNLTWFLAQDRGRVAAVPAMTPPQGTKAPLRLVPPPPPFNPETAVAIAIFMGNQSSTGPRIDFQGTTTSGGRLVITARGHYPGGPPPLAVTSPCLLLQIERPAMPIVVRARFRETFVEATD